MHVAGVRVLAFELHWSGLAMNSFPYAFALASLSLVACAVDAAPTTDPDPTTDTYGTIRQPGQGRISDVPAVAPVGIANATDAQRARLIEAALGVDVDRAMMRAESLRGELCPVSSPTAKVGQTVLTGCTGDVRSISGSVAIAVDLHGVTTYTFHDYDLVLDRGHEHYDGVVVNENSASAPTLRADKFSALRSYDHDADGIVAWSRGTWENVHGRIMALSITPTMPLENVLVGIAGVGGYQITAGLELATDRGSVQFSNGVGSLVNATNAGNGACWKLEVDGLALPDACDLDTGFTALDPR